MSKSKRSSKKELAEAVYASALPPIEPAPSVGEVVEQPGAAAELVEPPAIAPGPELVDDQAAAELPDAQAAAEQAKLDLEPCQVRERIVSNGLHCRHNGSFRPACDECMDAIVANELPSAAAAAEWLKTFSATGLQGPASAEDLVDPVRRLRRLLLLKAAVDVKEEMMHADVRRLVAEYERFGAEREQLRRALNGFRIVPEQREG